MPGFFLVATISVAAYLLGSLVPLVGGPVFGILIGMLVAFWQRPVCFEEGILFLSK